MVYVDTNVLICALEGEEEIATPILTLLVTLQERARPAVTSELTLAEVLAPVKFPGARTVADKLVLYDAVFATGLVEAIPVSRTVLRETASLRETYPRKLPDAIHVVTALQARCPYLMSGDKGMERLPPPLQLVLPNEAGIARVIDVLRG